jgi:hypothetical protein
LSSVSAEGLEAKTFSNAKIVKKSVKVNKVDTVLISAEIKGSYLTDEIEKMGLGDFGIDTSTLKPMKVSIWIDKKTYRPVKRVIDYKDFYSSLLGGYFDVSVAKSTTTYKNFNKAKAFSLPKSCK